MTIPEFRETKDYKRAMKKIQDYSQGFKFTLNYSSIPVGKANALKILMEDCINYNFIKSISIELALNGPQTAETFQKI